MAQLVAHLHGMQGVRGSSPLSSTQRHAPPARRAALSRGCCRCVDRAESAVLPPSAEGPAWPKRRLGDRGVRRERGAPVSRVFPCFTAILSVRSAPNALRRMRVFPGCERAHEQRHRRARTRPADGARRRAGGPGRVRRRVQELPVPHRGRPPAGEQRPVGPPRRRPGGRRGAARDRHAGRRPRGPPAQALVRRDVPAQRRVGPGAPGVPGRHGPGRVAAAGRGSSTRPPGASRAPRRPPAPWSGRSSPTRACSRSRS